MVVKTLSYFPTALGFPSEPQPAGLSRALSLSHVAEELTHVEMGLACPSPDPREQGFQ